MEPAFATKYDLSARQVEHVKGLGLQRPSIRDAVQTIQSLRQQLTHASASVLERRYPYLDQELLEFLTTIPLDQLLRPGERRSLMRRALADLLPEQVASRKTKAGAARCYSIALARNWERLSSVVRDPIIARLGYINEAKFRSALMEMRNGLQPRYFLRLLKALSLELWLREVVSRDILELNCDFRTMPSGPVLKATG
jgi:asparagine synthase (glutamine-hydrolysing)